MFAACQLKNMSLRYDHGDLQILWDQLVNLREDIDALRWSIELHDPSSADRRRRYGPSERDIELEGLEREYSEVLKRYHECRMALGLPRDSSTQPRQMTAAEHRLRSNPAYSPFSRAFDEFTSHYSVNIGDVAATRVQRREREPRDPHHSASMRAVLMQRCDAADVAIALARKDLAECDPWRYHVILSAIRVEEGRQKERRARISALAQA